MARPSICHIIVAAGSGSRFGAALPKQFCEMLGRPVLMETIERMRRFGRGGDIILVLNPDWFDFWEDCCRRHGFVSPRLTPGGDTRWASVKNALSLVDPSTDIITVHDGARPAITDGLVGGVIDAVAEGAPGAIPAVDVTDSLRMTDPDGGSHAVERRLFKAVQTPQAFSGKMLLEAYRLPYSPAFTDDASVMEAAFPRCRLRLTPGSENNIKITHLPDLRRAADFISSAESPKD